MYKHTRYVQYSPYFYATVLGTLFFLSSCATSPTPLPPPTPEISYTTDAEIAPLEVLKWEAVYFTPPNTKGIYYIVSENPLLRGPVKCDIKYILCQVDNIKMRLVGYAYYLDGKLHVYELQTEDETLNTGHFARIEVDEIKRRLIEYFLLKFLEMGRTELRKEAPMMA